MKKTIGFLVIAGILAASLISLNGCSDAAKKDAAEVKGTMEEAGHDIKVAAQASNEEAKRKATADWQQFKNDSDSTIADLEKQVQDLKVKIAKKDKNARAKLSSDLNKAEVKLNEQREKLKQRSIEFDNDVKQFDESVVAKNDLFKREFKHDMDELGTALKDLFKDNVN